MKVWKSHLVNVTSQNVNTPVAKASAPEQIPHQNRVLKSLACRSRWRWTDRARNRSL